MKTLRTTILYAALLGIAAFASIRHPHQVIAGAQQNPVPSCPIDPSQCQ